MPEQILLSVPIVTATTTTGFRVTQLLLDPEHNLFVLTVKGTNGELAVARREGEAARILMSQLNIANGTVKSLQRRALEWMQAQPEGAALVGTITGTPD